MTNAFLVVAVLGALITLNALRPARTPSLGAPSFFAAWLTSELAPHHLVAHVVVSGAFVAGGAVDGTTGLIALALSLATAAGLLFLIVQSHRAREVVDQALCEGLGDDYPDRIDSDRAAHYDLRVPWRQLLLPFRMRHPDVERVRNIAYKEGGGRRGRLDVYRRRDRPIGCPALLQVHGGGWVIGNKDQQGKPLMLHLASRGWVCFAANYRLSPRATFPDHLIDIKAALAWIRQHGPEYGADPGFVVITGGSAGGHLSALAALTANDPEYQPGFEDADTHVQASVPYYGVYDFTNEAGIRFVQQRNRFLERWVMKKKFATHREDYEKASPLYRINPDAPPMFVIHGARDSLVPVEEARWFVDRLRSISRAPVVYAELPGTQHAFEVFPSIRTAHVVRAVERFLDVIYSVYLAESKAGTPSHTG